MCILLIENNAEDYARMFCEQRKISRKEARPKYTKVECVDKKFKGWDRRGIRRFSNIVAAMKKNSELSTSKEIEMKLKANLIKIAGKGTETEDIES